MRVTHVLTQTDKRTALLADALRDVVAELRLIEVGDLIGYIRAEQWASLTDLVETSTELSFRDGTLLFACMADYTVDWSHPPIMSLEFEFQSAAVSAFFNLRLADRSSTVELRDIWFAATPPDEATGTRLLADALRAARCPPARNQRP